MRRYDSGSEDTAASAQDDRGRWPGRASGVPPAASGALQRKESPGGGGPIRLPDGLASPAAMHASADSGVAGAGQALPFQADIQRSFGAHDISGVRAHTGERAAAANAELGARAYAKGNDVAFGAEPDLHTAAHEAAHVVQQRAGVHLKGGVGAVGDPYEQHADAVADAVVAGDSAEPLLDAMAGPASRGSGSGAPALQHQKVTPPPDQGDKCEPQNGPSPIGTVKTKMLEAAGHATTARALVPELRNALELYIKVFNASEAEQRAFGEQEKKLKQIIAEKKQTNFLQVATFVAQVATSVAAGYAASIKAVEWVALAASTANDSHQAFQALVGEDTRALEQLVASNQQFATAAANVRADLGSAVTIIQNVIDKLISGELYQAGIKIHSVTEEIARGEHCGMRYDAAEMAALLKPLRKTAGELNTLAGEVAVLRAMAGAATNKEAVRGLEQDTPKRKGYDMLVEMAKASADGLRLIMMSDEGSYGLLMTEEVRAKLAGTGWNDHDFGFHRFDIASGSHKLFRVQYLRDGDLAMVFPLLTLGLRFQVQKGRPDLNWTKLPGIKDS